MLHVEVHQVVPRPAVNREDDEDEEIRGERQGFGGRHSSLHLPSGRARLRGAKPALVSDRNSNDTIVYITEGPEQSTKRATMNPFELRSLIDDLARGEIDTATAHDRLLEVLRARPFEDLGFARVDHHRSVRQGFPEVILGLGKTPSQIAGIAAAIVGKGSTLVVTRASQAAYEAVRAMVPTPIYHADAALITCQQQDVVPGKGMI